jgi:hypothetical protein
MNVLCVLAFQNELKSKLGSWLVRQSGVHLCTSVHSHSHFITFTFFPNHFVHL